MTNIDTHPYAQKGVNSSERDLRIFSYDVQWLFSTNWVDDCLKCVYLHQLILHKTLLHWNSIKYF